jgi:hypothetical protein
MPPRDEETRMDGGDALAHLDEGTVHAWLDDALPPGEAHAVELHVARCAACAALVAEARGLVAGASRILGALDGVPGGVLPARWDERDADEVASTGPESPEAPRPGTAARRPPSRWRPSRAALRAAVALLMVGGGTAVVLQRGGGEASRRAYPASATEAMDASVQRAPVNPVTPPGAAALEGEAVAFMARDSSLTVADSSVASLRVPPRPAARRPVEREEAAVAVADSLARSAMSVRPERGREVAGRVAPAAPERMARARSAEAAAPAAPQGPPAPLPAPAAPAASAASGAAAGAAAAPTGVADATAREGVRCWAVGYGRWTPDATGPRPLPPTLWLALAPDSADGAGVLRVTTALDGASGAARGSARGSAREASGGGDTLALALRRDGARWTGTATWRPLAGPERRAPVTLAPGGACGAPGS